MKIAKTDSFQGEVIRDYRGREVVRFTTASGVQAIIATCIPETALAKMARKLERKIARRRAGWRWKRLGSRPRVPPR
jgi:nitrate/TMAO reductase-like tetraheme cytochrome c subunit